MAFRNFINDQNITKRRRTFSSMSGGLVPGLTFLGLAHTCVLYGTCASIGAPIYEDFTLYTNPVIFVLGLFWGYSWEEDSKSWFKLVIIPIITSVLTACNIAKLILQFQKTYTLQDYDCHYYWGLAIAGVSLIVQIVLILAGFYVVQHPRIGELANCNGHVVWHVQHNAAAAGAVELEAGPPLQVEDEEDDPQEH